MARYAAGRVLQAVLVTVAAYVASFLILFALPGDPITGMYSGGDAGVVSQEELDEIRAEYGFDRPLYEQFFTRFGAALVGDFGLSIRNAQPVTEVIGEAIPHTVALVGLAVLLAIVLGVAVALAATATRRNWLRQVLLTLPSFGVSMPTFWVGLILVQIFAFTLKWLPPIGNAGFQSLVLPAITLALPGAAQIAQVLAKSLATARGEPYIVTARSIGLAPSVILTRDTLRNAIIPAMTMAGLLIANMFGGSIVVESVFSRAGLGQITVKAVLGHDIPTVQAVVVLGALVFALVTLVVDLLYPVVDPRLRPSTRGAR